jgi:hypothetical protein
MQLTQDHPSLPFYPVHIIYLLYSATWSQYWLCFNESPGRASTSKGESQKRGEEKRAVETVSASASASSYPTDLLTW